MNYLDVAHAMHKQALDLAALKARAGAAVKAVGDAATKTHEHIKQRHADLPAEKEQFNTDVDNISSYARQIGNRGRIAADALGLPANIGEKLESLGNDYADTLQQDKPFWNDAYDRASVLTGALSNPLQRRPSRAELQAEMQRVRDEAPAQARQAWVEGLKSYYPNLARKAVAGAGGVARGIRNKTLGW